MLRRLPVRVDPVPGESLDSWLEALSRRLSTPAVDLLPALGLDVAPQRRRAAAFGVFLRADEASRVAEVTGVPVPVLQEMTLAHYDAVVRADPETRRLVPRHVWTQRPGTWFCPHCLAESGGRWQLRWQLGWSFACVRHRCLLADRCPGCGHVPRPGTLWLHVPQASRCSTRPGTARRNFERCGANLTTAAVHELGAGHAVLAAQHLLDTVLTTGTAAFGLYTASPAHRLLTDLAVLASRILRTAEVPRAADPRVGDLSDVYRAALTGTDGSGRRSGSAPAHSVLAAVATTRALTVLSAADETTAVALLTSLCAPGSAGRRLVAPHHARQRPITPQLAGVLQRGRRTLFPPPPPPSCARTTRPRTPSGRRRDLLGSTQRCPDRDRAASIPAVFWPWWTLRLAPQWSVDRLMRGAFACLSTSSGTALSIPGTVTRLGVGITNFYVAQALHRLATEPAWDAQRTALARIARHLDHHGTPIDYARRRALDYTDLLPEPRWETLLARTGFRRHRGTLRSMRCLLFETISGKPASAAPQHYAPHTKIQRDAFSDFPTLLTARIATELHLVATDFLADHGIDEPVSWQPPRELADRLNLPGPDPDALPRQLLTDLLGADIPLGQAASQAGMTLNSARYVLTHYPRDTSSDRDVGERLRALLPAETFRDLYIDRGWSLSALAVRYGVNRRRITTLATAYDIPLRDPSKPPSGISRRWLHEQYVRRGRSSEDLGAELGLHPTTILSWCRRYNLPVRPGGPNVHRSALYTAEAIPPELRPALTGTHPWKRLIAFVRLRDHPTLRTAAATLAINPKTLASYVRRLERELGQQLVHRSTTLAPITTLTEQGQVLASTIATLLAQTPGLARNETRCRQAEAQPAAGVDLRRRPGERFLQREAACSPRAAASPASPGAQEM